VIEEVKNNFHSANGSGISIQMNGDLLLQKYRNDSVLVRWEGVSTKKVSA
jgi:hypothetical protein